VDEILHGLPVPGGDYKAAAKNAKVKSK
jgi:hypothetical protein